MISPSTLILHCTLLLLEFELGGPFEGAIYPKRCIQCTIIFSKKRKNSSLCAESIRHCDFSSSSKGFCILLLLKLFRPKCLGQWDIASLPPINPWPLHLCLDWIHTLLRCICWRIWDQQRCAREEVGVCFITSIGWWRYERAKDYICMKIHMTSWERYQIIHHNLVHLQILV